MKNIGVASDHDFLSHDHACSASLGAYIPDDSDLCLEAFLACRDNERVFKMFRIREHGQDEQQEKQRLGQEGCVHPQNQKLAQQAVIGHEVQS